MAPRNSIRARRRAPRVRVFVDPTRLLPRRATAAAPTLDTLFRVLDGLRRLPLAAS